jgi:hypothetical protein
MEFVCLELESAHYYIFILLERVLTSTWLLVHLYQHAVPLGYIDINLYRSNQSALRVRDISSEQLLTL